MKTKEIIPGKGVGDVLLGMDRNQVEALLGKPDELDEFEYDDGEDAITWYYYDLGIDFNFESSDDYKLSFLSVESDEFSIAGKIKVGMKREEIIEKCKELGFEYNEVENVDIEDEYEEAQELITVEEENINFWFTEGVLEEIQIGPFWEDDDTPSW